MLLIFILLSKASYAQDLEVTINRLSVENGMSSNKIFCTYQDKEGFLWFGTPAGINRYDGYQIKVIDIFNTPQLSNNKVFAIVQDSTGNLWVGTENGLNLLDAKGKVKKVYLSDPEDPNSLSDNRISLLTLGKDGSIWVGTNNGTVDKYLGGDEFQNIYRSDFLEDKLIYGEGDIFNPVEYIREDHTGYLWIRQHNGVYSRTKGPLSVSSELEQPVWVQLPESIAALGIDAQLDAWALTENALLKFNHELDSFIVQRSVSGIQNVRAGTLLSDRQGDFWVLGKTSIGKVELKNDRYTTYSKQLANEGIQAFDGGLIDLTGAIWVASPNNGVASITTKRSIFGTAQTKNHSLSVENVFGMVVDRDNNLYLHSEGRLIKLDLQTKKVRNTLLVEGINNELADDGSILWAANSTYGLCKIDKNTGANTSYELEYKTQFHTVLKGLSGELWVGTGTGLFTFDTQKEEFDQIEGLRARVLKIIQSKDSIIWAATSKGLYMVSAQKEILEHYSPTKNREKGLKTGYLHTLYEDKEGIVWLGGESGGLIRFDPEQEEFRHYTKEDRLANNNVRGIIEYQGFLWISTYHGLSSFDLDQEVFKNYYEEDGLSHNSFNMNSVLKTSDNQLYFGGPDEVIVFNPEQVRDQKDEGYDYNIPLILTELTKQEGGTNRTIDLLHYATDPDQTIELNYDDRNLRFSFSLADFSNPSRNEYAYTMEGIDDAWYSLGSNNSIDFPSLPYGNYILRVRARNASGKWSKEELAVPISMNRIFYKNPTFIIVSILLGIFVTSLFFRWRLISLKKTRDQQEQIIQERTKQIRAQKEELEKDKKTIEKQAEKLQDFNAVQTRWFTNIAHELRTPLTLILGPIRQFLNVHADSPKNGIENIQLAEKNSIGLLRLVNEILDVSRLESNQLKLKREATNLTSLIRETAAQFDSVARQKGITLQIHIKDEIDITIDKDRIQNILINLISNALKFTHEKEHVSVSVMNMGEKGVEISIADTGDGIPEKDLPHVFDRYYQADDPNRMNQGGAGIGLALSRELAELHGGKLSVFSKLGEGSTFTLSLPESLVIDARNPGSLEPITIVSSSFSQSDFASSKSNVSVNHSQRPSVLLVDDNADMRQYIQSFMSEKYVIMAAGDGIEALEYLEETIPDLIISDVMMPRMDGIELAKELKNHESWKYIPFITLTARATEVDKIATLRIGIDDYLTKPFNAEELKVRAANLIDNFQQRKAAYEASPDKPEESSYQDKLIVSLKDVVMAQMKNESFTIDDLADSQSMSVSSLKRALKRSAGMSPGRFIREIRLQEARNFLEVKRFATVLEVAYAVGYENASHFTKLYYERFGKKPSEYQ